MGGGRAGSAVPVPRSTGVLRRRQSFDCTGRPDPAATADGPGNGVSRQFALLSCSEHLLSDTEQSPASPHTESTALLSWRAHSLTPA